MSPKAAELGSVAVIAALDVSTKYPRLAAAVKALVLISQVKSCSTVTDPPRATAEPFIVIEELASAEFGTDESRALGSVPLRIFDAFILASWNVPKATMSTTSPFARAEAKTTEFPLETVISAGDILTPFKYTSKKGGSKARVSPLASAPLTVVGVPVIL